MTQPYTFETTGRASAIPLALWMMDYVQGTLDDRFQLSFKPVVGAYVACVRISQGQASMAITRRDIRYGRTNEVGWVVQRVLSALGDEAEVPPQPWSVAPAPVAWFLSGDDPVAFQPGDQRAEPTLMYGLPNEGYRIFWCRDRQLFDKFTKELEADAAKALDDWGARLYVMEAFGAPHDVSALDVLTRDEQGVVSRLFFPGQRYGYHAGWYFKDLRTAAIFDATPASFRALFLSEWLEWYSARLRTDKSWRTLVTALHVSAIAEQGATVAEFERLSRVGRVGVEPRVLEAFADYRRYAWECAKVCARLPRGRREDFRAIYQDAITVLASGTRWQDRANEIRRVYGPVHPWQTGRYRAADLLLDGEDERKPLTAYFDFYVEGLRCRDDGLTERIHSAMKSVDEAFEWIGHKRKSLLQAQSQARHDALMRDIAMCAPVDLGIRLGLIDRHARQCASVQFAWWHEADASYLATVDQWQSFTEKLGWMTGTVNGVGNALGGFVETYSGLYKHTPDGLRAVVRLCLRYERWLKAGVIEDLTLNPAHGRLSYEIKGAAASVSLSIEVGNKKLAVGDYRIVKQLDIKPSRYQGPTGHVTATSVRTLKDAELSREFRAARPLLLAVDPELVERIEGHAGVVSTMGALLSVGLALNALAQSKDTGWELYTSRPVLEATWSALEGIGAASQVVKAARKSMGLTALAEHTMVWAARAGGVGTAIEGVATLSDGYKALYSDESDMVAALDRGDSTRAALEFTKGVAQVAGGVGGVGAGIAGFAGMSLVAGPFALVFGLAGAAVVVTQIAIYMRTGGGNRVQPLIDQIAAAERSEFHLDARNHATAASDQPVLLRQRVGVLNELLNRGLRG